LKIEKLVEERRVKRHLFMPSRRELWTVVGLDSEHLIFPELPYCTCGHFYFSVLSGRSKLCYHLEGAERAMKENAFETVDFDDSEYAHMLHVLIDDVVREWKAKQIRGKSSTNEGASVAQSAESADSTR